MNQKIFQLLLVIFLSYSISFSLTKLTLTSYVESCISSKAQIQTALSNEIYLKDRNKIIEAVNIFYESYRSECMERAKNLEFYNFIYYLDDLF